MKKGLSAVLLLAFTGISLAFGACSKQDAECSGTAEKHIIYASFEGGHGSKTTIDESYTPQWVVGDIIWLSNGTVASEGEVIDVLENRVAKIETSLSGNTIYAVYPYGSGRGVDASGNIVLSIPSEVHGSFGEANVCAARASKGGNLLFRNACAVLKVSGRTRTVKACRVYGSGICGEFVFNPSTKELSAVANTSGSTIDVTLQGDDKGAFYIPAAAGTVYGAGEKVASYLDAAGEELNSRVFKNALTLERSKLYNLGTTYYVIDGGME